jgi:Tfp pilus assembly protein FimT
MLMLREVLIAMAAMAIVLVSAMPAPKAVYVGRRLRRRAGGSERN